jgi:hypothetical protein
MFPHCFSRALMFVRLTGALGRVLDPTWVCTQNPAKFLGVRGNFCDQFPNTYCADQGFNADGLNFDSFSSSFITVLVCITGEGWTNVMYQAQDVFQKWVQLYFIAMMVVVYMFVIQLVTAVLQDKFSEAKEAEEQKRICASCTVWGFCFFFSLSQLPW